MNQTGETLQETQATNVIEVADIALAPAKFPPKTTKEGFASTLHTITILKGVGVSVKTNRGNDFRYRPATGETPALMHCFFQQFINIHLYNGVDLDEVREGKRRFDVEIAANIVRDSSGKIVDRHVYFNVRPAAEPNGRHADEVVTVHAADNIPAYNATVYRGRKSAIAIRKASEVR